MSEHVFIFDTTLRDGEQSPGNTMNTQEKLRVARQLELSALILSKQVSPSHLTAISMPYGRSQNSLRIVRWPVLRAPMTTISTGHGRPSRWPPIPVSIHLFRHRIFISNISSKRHEMKSCRSPSMQRNGQKDIRTMSSFPPWMQRAATGITSVRLSRRSLTREHHRQCSRHGRLRGSG